jgi:hypothetical protein
VLDEELVNGLVSKLMSIDDKVQRLVDGLLEDDDGEEEMDS